MNLIQRTKYIELVYSQIYKPPDLRYKENRDAEYVMLLKLLECNYKKINQLPKIKVVKRQSKMNILNNNQRAALIRWGYVR